MNLRRTGIAAGLVLAVVLLVSGGCDDTFRKAVTPELFTGLNQVADDVFSETCDGFNSIIDALLTGLERTVYPEGS
ncbi:MAG: hypothetical protein GXY33_20835 [Phycisphaerae bacterium]|nr:hypothetical protein [Phycisphaerae bacterium]